VTVDDYFAFEREPTEGGSVLRLTGAIDADLDPVRFASALEGPTLIDADGVQRVSSSGVRQWSGALERRRAGDPLSVVRARPAFVVELNTTRGFAGPLTLLSLYLPYECPACHTPHDELLDVRADWAAIQLRQAPTRRCPACHAESAFDEGPEYFAWVASHPRPEPPRWMLRVVGESDGDLPELRVAKEVTEHVTALWLSGAPSTRTRLRRRVAGLEPPLVVVFGGVPRVPRDAAGALTPLVDELAREGAWLARLRPQALAPMLARDKERLTGRVIDFLLPGRCHSCEEAVEARIRLAQLRDADAAAPCPACGEPLELLVNRSVLRPLERFLADDVDPDVTDYLEARGDEPPLEPAGDEAARYEALRPIGFGGMAEVLLARQRGPAGFARTVALKRILPEYASDRGFVDLFLREARVAARVTHANVVQIYDLGVDAGRYFIAMEYVRGWDLASVIRVAAELQEPIPAELACAITIDLLRGLHAAHTCTNETDDPAPILHRDVSPHNVLLSSRGEVKLSDFGVSKAADLTSHSKPGSVKGKIYYVAPERIDPRIGAVDARSDLFSAGLVLYEMLTGFAPFRRRGNVEAMRAVLEAKVPPLEEARAGLPRSLVAATERALTRDPDERWPTAQRFEAALSRIAEQDLPRTSPKALAGWLARLETEARAIGEAMRPGLPSRRSVVSAELEQALESLSIVVEDVDGLHP
jgi:serine/threonine protein kinase